MGKLRKWIRRKLSGISVEQLTFGWENRKRPDLRQYSKKYKKVKDLASTPNSALIITTVALQPLTIAWMNDMVRRKIYHSRSYIVRLALNDFFKYEGDFIEFLEKKYGKYINIDDKIVKVIKEA